MAGTDPGRRRLGRGRRGHFPSVHLGDKPEVHQRLDEVGYVDVVAGGLPQPFLDLGGAQPLPEQVQRLLADLGQRDEPARGHRPTIQLVAVGAGVEGVQAHVVHARSPAGPVSSARAGGSVVGSVAARRAVGPPGSAERRVTRQHQVHPETEAGVERRDAGQQGQGRVGEQSAGQAR